MNNEKVEKYLPIGTVVMLKNAEKRIMITGFCMVPKEEETKVYDYTGTLYPEGVIKSEQCLMFNHDQIDKIYHMGLIDEEEKEFKKTLKQLLEQSNNNSDNNIYNENPSLTEIRISE